MKYCRQILLTVREKHRTVDTVYVIRGETNGISMIGDSPLSVDEKSNVTRRDIQGPARALKAPN